ncbi:MAG: ParB N-terminal domain-containing protein [Ignavibacteriales bacterium]|nr:ParB N-terminal domain-containing protein [Ignavibacteriales bacterium]
MKIKINQIRIPARKRILRDVTELAASINSVGLLNPITVIPTLDGFELVAGMHRLEAHKLLGLTEIEVNVLFLTELDRELAELDENLIRNELTALERSEQFKRRKEIYEAKYPNTKHGARNGKNYKDVEITSLTTPSFTTDTSNKINKSKSTVEKELQIANRIPQNVRDLIRETPLAEKKTELLELSKFDSQTQQQVVEMIAKGEVQTVGQAISKINRVPKKSAAEVVAVEQQNSITYKWPDTLQQAAIGLKTIKKLGGIQKIATSWNADKKNYFIRECLVYAKTFTEFAEEIKSL